jgi:hypothetical protein
MNFFSRLFLLVATLISQGVLAQSVGRTDVKDLAAPWEQLAAYDTKGLSLDGGIKRIPMQGLVFLNKPDGLLLIVESTTAGHGNTVNWVSMKCPPTRENFFTNDYGSNQASRDTQCLVANAKFSSKTYLAEVSPQAAEATEKQGLRFEKGQLVRAWSGVSRGTYLKVHVFSTSAFRVADPASKESTSGVNEALVAFGEALHKAVYDSTQSLSGNLSLQLLNNLK